MDRSRSLHLLRHAKSSWADDSLADRDRPLAPRGIRACALVRDDLAARALAPGLVLCSPAVRTRETLRLIAAGLGDPEVAFRDEIYEASRRDLLELVRRRGGDHAAVMVIGHMPAIGELAVDIAGVGDEVALSRMRRKFPTAALASIEFDGAWPELGSGAGRLTAFVRPKDLAG